MSPRKQSRTIGKTRPGKSSSYHALSATEIRRFGRLADGLHIGFGLIDPSGTILYANSTFRNSLGIANSIASTKPVQEYLSGHGQRDFETALAQAHLSSVQGTFEILCEGGDLRTVEMSMSRRQRDDDDDDDSLWMLTRDVTEFLKVGKALHDSEDSLHLLSGRLMKAQDVERRRMARDLHDTTGQELAVILLSLTRLCKSIDTPGFDAKPVIEDAIGIVRKVEEEIRTLSYVLHPPMLDDLGLRSALGWYVEGFTKRSKIDVDLDIPDTIPRLSKDKEIAIFRVVQECLSNVLRHSGSPTACIRADAQNGHFRLSVEDSGRGFAAKPQRSLKPDKVTLGVGILGMRERLQQLGGFLDVDSKPAGTKITAGVPLEVEAERSADPLRFGEATAFATGEVSPEEGQEPIPRRRILIADDHELMRRGINNLLAGEADLEVCGEATDGFETIVKTGQLRPDLVILDLSIPKLGGFAVAQQIHQQHPSTKILVFTNHAYSPVKNLIQTLGCEGFVSKARASTDLIRGVRTVLGGHKYYEPESAQAHSA